MLTPQHCDLFQQPFFQFAQLKRYCPERIEPLKVAYKKAWLDWQHTILTVAQQLGNSFASPHIERWCNGWQVRAHFFAYFKYTQYQHSAAILSVILNRRRLTVSLDWHSYRANRSIYTLHDYHQWLNLLNLQQFADFDIWHGDDDEYADYSQVSSVDDLILRDENDFFCIGKHIERDQLAQSDVLFWATETITRLLPLYEQIHIDIKHPKP